MYLVHNDAHISKYGNVSTYATNPHMYSSSRLRTHISMYAHVRTYINTSAGLHTSVRSKYLKEFEVIFKMTLGVRTNSLGIFLKGKYQSRKISCQCTFI